MVRTTLFTLDDLVIDVRIYPRKTLNNHHVNDLVRAFQSGALIPPILVAQGTNCLIDGRHRTEAARKLGMVALPAHLKKYPDEPSMLEEAIRLNTHGQKLNHYDMAHCVILARQIGLSQDRLATAMSTTKNFIDELWSMKTAYYNDEPVAIKRSHFELAQQNLTTKQFLANEKSTGVHAIAVANQLINLLDGKVINWDNHKLVEKLELLYIKLAKAFAPRKEVKSEIATRNPLRKIKKV